MAIPALPPGQTFSAVGTAGNLRLLTPSIRLADILQERPQQMFR